MNYKDVDQVHKSIADYIRQQKQSDEPIALKNFLTEIKSIAGAHTYIIPNTDYIGTSVPNSGILGNVYTNLDMPIDDVISLLSKLPVTHFDNLTLGDNLFESVGVYIIAASIIDNLTYGLIYVRTSDNKHIIYLINANRCILIFYENEWLHGNVAPHAIFNVPLTNAFNIDGTTIPVGNANDLISSLFSTTIINRNINTDYIGTAIPTEGEIGTVYLNKNMDITNIRNIINTLPFTTINNGENLAYLVATDATTSLVILKNNITELSTEFIIALYQDGNTPMIPIFASNKILAIDNGLDDAGWNPDIDNIILNISCSDTSEILSTQITLGKCNDVIENILSISEIQPLDLSEDLIGEYTATTLNVTDNTRINLREHLNKKQIPLDIKIKTDAYIEGINPVISGQYVGTVNFDIKTSIETVVSYLSQLSYNDGVYPIIVNESIDKGIIAFGDTSTNDYLIYVIKDNDFFAVFTNNIEVAKDFGMNLIGWNPEFNGKYVINSGTITYVEGLAIGIQNEILTPIINTSSTEDGNIDLAGKYDGSAIVLNNASGYIGNTVPNTGRIDTIYFNTNLSVNDVIKILKPLNYNMAGMAYFIASATTDGTNNCIAAASIDGWYGILAMINSTQTVLFSSFSNSSMDADFSGWNTNFIGHINFNNNVVNQVLGENNNNENVYFDAGHQNDIISMLVSSTQFNKINDNIAINIEKFIDSRKIPLNVKVKFPTFNIGYSKAITTVDKGLYVNTNLSIEEVDAILDKLDYCSDTLNYAYEWLAINSDYFNQDTQTFNVTTFISIDRHGEQAPFNYEITAMCNGAQYTIYDSDTGFGTFPNPIPMDFTKCILNMFSSNNNIPNTQLVSKLLYTMGTDIATGDYKYESLSITTNGVLNLKDKLLNDKILIDTLNISVPSTGSSGEPIEISTATEMEAILTDTNIGKVYIYIGETTDDYTYGDIYIVEADE